MSVPRFRIIRSQAEAINAEVVREVGARVDEGGKAQGRICGDCRLCCKTLEVPELQKPAGKWCGHAYLETGGAQCSIYDKRPESCRAFRCMWLAGFFEDRDRPDRSRLVIAEALDEVGNARLAEHPQTKAAFPLLYVFEAHVGAVDGPGRLLAQTLLGSGVALAIMHQDGERLRELRFPMLVEGATATNQVKIDPGKAAGT